MKNKTVNAYVKLIETATQTANELKTKRNEYDAIMRNMRQLFRDSKNPETLPEYQEYNEIAEKDSLAYSELKRNEIIANTASLNMQRYVLNQLEQEICKHADTLANLPMWHKRNQKAINDLLCDERFIVYVSDCGQLKLSVAKYDSFGFHTYFNESIYLPNECESFGNFNKWYLKDSDSIRKHFASPHSYIKPSDIAKRIDKALRDRDKAIALTNSFCAKFEKLRESSRNIAGIDYPDEIRPYSNYNFR